MPRQSPTASTAVPAPGASIGTNSIRIARLESFARPAAPSNKSLTIANVSVVPTPAPIPCAARQISNAAKDLGVFNMAGALPFSIAPGIAPAILAVGSGSYGVLYGVAGVCAIIGAVAILPVKRVR